jgi:G2/mitotic-specific cyclin-B3
MDIVATPVPQAKRSKKETVSPTRVVDMNEEQYLGYDSLEGYLEYLKDTEHYATISPYMEKQSYITTGMRAILVDWMCELCYNYSLHRVTFHLSVLLLDRYLSKVAKALFG